MHLVSIVPGDAPLPVSEPLDKQNRWIWPFELLERIGEGGMGAVYRARFVKNDRVVAVKLLPADVTDKKILARFEREMQVLRSLRHPSIVHCFGGVCEGDRRFYAMEYVAGGTLSELLRKHGRLAPDRTIGYALEMCQALEAAHERGVIHRDVKPANFLITAEGRLKLSDFGVAAVLAGRRITADDRTVGTFLYMAPEQISGKPPVSPQTDLYALGCVLFELLTGRPPFQGATSGEVLQKHLNKPPPPVSSLAMSCPPELDDLIARLLAKKPGDRPSSAAAVASELTALQTSVTLIERRSAGLAPTKPAIAGPSVPPPEPEEPVQAAAGGVRPRLSSAPLWLLAGCLVAVAALVLWNRSLSRRAEAFARAEKAWIAASRDENLLTRVTALRALGGIAHASQPALDRLIEALDDEHLAIRRAAAEALGEAGAAGTPALSKLISLEKFDDRPQVRKAAGIAVKQIRAAPKETSPWPWTIAVVLLIVAVAGGWWLRRKFLAETAPLES